VSTSSVPVNYQRLVDASPSAVFFTDSQGKCVYMNAALRDLFALAADGSCDENWLSTLHDEDKTRVLQAWQETVSSAKDFAKEFCIHLKEGKLCYVLAKAQPLFEGEALLGFLGCVEDITDRYLLQQVVSERENSHARLLGNLSGMAYRSQFNDTRVMSYVSAGCKELTGFEGSVFTSGNGCEFASLIHHDDREQIEQTIKNSVSHGLPFRCEYRIVSEEGVIKWVWDQGEGVFDEEACLMFVEGLMTDITSQKLTENALRDERNLLSTIINSSTDFIFAKDKDLRLFLCNEAYASAMGAMSEDLYGKTDLENGVTEELVKGNVDDGFRGYEQDDLDALTGVNVKNHHDLVRVNGEMKIFDTVKLPIKDASNAIIGVLGVARDITDESAAADKIWHQANYDALTNLPNRSMFADRLQHQMQKSERNKTGFSLLFIDLDHFKQINDTLGHEAGDALLVEVARRLSQCVRSSDTVSRFAGDEFTLLLPEASKPVNVQKVARAIHRALEKPFYLNGETHYISASVGASIYPTDGKEISELMRFADQAMYQAKRSGRGKSCFFTPRLQEDAERRRRLVADLRFAIKRGELELYYQPIVDLQDGRIHKAEALLRWNHPLLGVLMPKEFIPLAEEEGLIIDIGEWVFEEAAREAKKCIENLYSDFQISINKSPAQFYSEDHLSAGSWLENLKNANLPGASLSLEITEGMLLDKGPKVSEKLLSFRDAGIQVALDDFGTGYSSLSYLKKFDIDIIKIDRCFVSNIESSPDDAILCEAMVALAHKLGLKVVAEGVETLEQFKAIQALGCDYVQGFYISEPKKSLDFENFVLESRRILDNQELPSIVG